MSSSLVKKSLLGGATDLSPRSLAVGGTAELSRRSLVVGAAELSRRSLVGGAAELSRRSLVGGAAELSRRSLVGGTAELSRRSLVGDTGAAPSLFFDFLLSRWGFGSGAGFRSCIALAGGASSTVSFFILCSERFAAWGLRFSSCELLLLFVLGS